MKPSVNGKAPGRNVAAATGATGDSAMLGDVGAAATAPPTGAAGAAGRSEVGVWAAGVDAGADDGARTAAGRPTAAAEARPRVMVWVTGPVGPGWVDEMTTAPEETPRSVSIGPARATLMPAAASASVRAAV